MPSFSKVNILPGLGSQDRREVNKSCRKEGGAPRYSSSVRAGRQCEAVCTYRRLTRERAGHWQATFSVFTTWEQSSRNIGTVVPSYPWFLFPTVLVPCSQMPSNNIKWKSPEINNSYISNCTDFWVAWWNLTYSWAVSCPGHGSSLCPGLPHFRGARPINLIISLGYQVFHLACHGAIVPGPLTAAWCSAARPSLTWLHLLTCPLTASKAE